MMEEFLWHCPVSGLKNDCLQL